MQRLAMHFSSCGVLAPVRAQEVIAGPKGAPPAWPDERSQGRKATVRAMEPELGEDLGLEKAA